MNKIAEFLRKHSIFDPRPFFWNLAILVYFVDTILFAIPFWFPYPKSAYVDLALGLTWFPGFWYSFGEFVKVVDEPEPTLGRVRNVMGICFVTFVFFAGVLRSVNNMAASVGGQFPFYPILRDVRVFVEPIVTFVIGVGAVLIRRKLPFSPFTAQKEERVQAPSGRRSPAWFFQVAGLLLILVGFYMGFVNIIALEALVVFVTGMILFPIGWLMRRMTKSESPTSALP